MKSTDRSRAESERMLPAKPKPLLRKVLEKVAALERSLRVQAADAGWSETPAYQAVLDEYRAYVVSGITSPRFIQRYGLLVLAASETLDEAFQDLHRYESRAWETKEAVAITESRLQSEKSKLAAIKRREKKEIADKRRKEVIGRAIDSLSKDRAFDLASALPMAIYKKFEHLWPDFHKEIGIIDLRIPERPAYNTVKAAIEEVRVERLGEGGSFKHPDH